jgi:hypothetical protein
VLLLIASPYLLRKIALWIIPLAKALPRRLFTVLFQVKLVLRRLPLQTLVNIPGKIQLNLLGSSPLTRIRGSRYYQVYGGHIGALPGMPIRWALVQSEQRLMVRRHRGLGE